MGDIISEKENCNISPPSRCTYQIGIAVALRAFRYCYGDILSRCCTKKATRAANDGSDIWVYIATVGLGVVGAQDVRGSIVRDK